MKWYLLLICCVICILSQFFLCFSHTTIYPIFDSPKGDLLPRNLRTTQLQSQVKLKAFNFNGLGQLKVSGSGQFSRANFKELQRHLPIENDQLIIFDLREESHGLINGVPISWTDGENNFPNQKKLKIEIERDEEKKLSLAMQTGSIIINPYERPSKIAVETIQTEKEFVESLGYRYFRLPVTDHHHPSDEVIDKFITLIKNLSDDQWVHIHCKGGNGRTTTFMILFDMMKNASQVELDHILARQQIIGGVDLSELESKSGEKRKAGKERLEFVKRFYAYCQQVPDFHMNWSTWVEQQSAIVRNP